MTTNNNMIKKIFMRKIIPNMSIIFLIVSVSIPVLLGVGWVMNLVKFVKLDFQAPYKAEVIRGISLTPVGAITGWIKIEDK